MIVDRTERLGRGIDPRWDAAQVEVSLAGLHRRMRARRRRAIVGAATGIALAAGVLIYLGSTSGPGSEAPPRVRARSAGDAPPDQDGYRDMRAPAAPQLVTSRAIATPLSRDAIVVAADDRGDAVAMRLERGAARFKVRGDRDRPFRVDAGPVLVEVVGTEFSIARESDHATVSVITGVVRVHWQGGQSRLHAGESGRFPPEDMAAGAPQTRRSGQGGASPRASRDARDDEADIEDDADALLSAADRARLAGRMDEAVSLIERALALALDPKREAAAAFTLGHVRSRLGEHELAADAFARARAADPQGLLAEDALAREVEAWARAGDAKRAEEAARRYLDSFPGGRRTRAVRKFGMGE
jgi:transmembrane sensor